MESARKGQEVCLKIEPIPGESPKMFGRHFDENDMLVSKVSKNRYKHPLVRFDSCNYKNSMDLSLAWASYKQNVQIGRCNLCLHVERKCNVRCVWIYVVITISINKNIGSGKKGSFFAHLVKWKSFQLKPVLNNDKH